MPARTMADGVSKSGSPMPSEITSSIVAAMSKKRRMPDGGTDLSLLATKSLMWLWTSLSSIMIVVHAWQYIGRELHDRVQWLRKASGELVVPFHGLLDLEARDNSGNDLHWQPGTAKEPRRQRRDDCSHQDHAQPDQ